MSETKQTIDTYVVIQISTITYIITAILCLLQAWILSDIIKSNVYDKLVMQLVISLISIFIYEKVLVEKRDTNGIIRYHWRIEKKFRILERIFILVSGIGNIVYLLGIFYRKKKFRQYIGS